jgi:hypothetical protein
LAGLLHDVVSDPEVRREFESLKREPPSFFKPERAGDVAVAGPTGPTGPEDERVPRPPERARLGPDESLDDETSAGSVRFGSSRAWVDGDETGWPSDMDPVEIARAAATPEFREFAEWTMEATLYNLVKELHASRTEEAAYGTEAFQSAAAGSANEWDSAGEDSYDFRGGSDEE